MGRSQSKVAVTRNAKSIEHPGLRSCVSGPLHKYCTYDSAWDCLIELLTSTTHSIVDSAKMGKVVEMKVDHTSDTECTVRRKINGPAFDAELASELGLSRQLLFEPDLKTLSMGQPVLIDKISIDKNSTRGMITIHKWLEDPKRLMNVTYLVLHRRPFRLEFWIETPRPRFNHPLLQQGMQAEIDMIMQRALEGDDYMKVMYVTMKLNSVIPFIKKWTHSRSDPEWDAYICEPLDDIISFDRMWAELRDITKYPPQHENSVLKQVGDSEFILTCPKKTTTIKKKIEKPKIEELEDETNVKESKGDAPAPETSQEAELRKVVEAASRAEPPRRAGKGQAERAPSARGEGTEEREASEREPASESERRGLLEKAEKKEEEQEFHDAKEEGEESEYEDVEIIHDHERKMELTVDEEKHVLRNKKYDIWGGHKNTDYHVLHKNPLQLEVWSERPYHRRSGVMIADMAQIILDTMLDRAEIVDGLMEQVDQGFYDCIEDDGYKYHSDTEKDPEAEGDSDDEPEERVASGSKDKGGGFFDFRPKKR